MEAKYKYIEKTIGIKFICELSISSFSGSGVLRSSSAYVVMFPSGSFATIRAKMDKFKGENREFKYFPN